MTILSDPKERFALEPEHQRVVDHYVSMLDQLLGAATLKSAVTGAEAMMTFVRRDIRGISVEMLYGLAKTLPTGELPDSKGTLPPELA